MPWCPYCREWIENYQEHDCPFIGVIVEGERGFGMSAFKMKQMSKKNVKELAEDHWKYVESICHKMYVDAFVHGFKHGHNEDR